MNKCLHYLVVTFCAMEKTKAHHFVMHICQNLHTLTLIPKALRGPFWAFGVFGHGPWCQFYFDFFKIASVGGDCD